MKLLIQRSLNSNVQVNNEIVGQISKGIVLFVCLENDDNVANLKKAASKLISLRIFEDSQGKMNKNILQIQGEILSISQFTLSWNGKGGNRPSFDNSMEIEKAKKLFSEFNKLLSEKCVVQTGLFQADMEVNIINDGPVTFFLDF